LEHFISAGHHVVFLNRSQSQLDNFVMPTYLSQQTVFWNQNLGALFTIHSSAGKLSSPSFLPHEKLPTGGGNNNQKT